MTHGNTIQTVGGHRTSVTSPSSWLMKMSICFYVLGFGFLCTTLLFGIGGLLVVVSWFVATFFLVASMAKSSSSTATSFSKEGTYWERDRSRYGDLLEPTDPNRL